MSDLIGREIGGFQIIEEIGRGGMTNVYKAYQPAMRRNVALIVLPQVYSHEPNYVARFKWGTRIHAQLDHPHIVPFHGCGEQDGIHYMAMSYMPGGTLAYYIQQHDRLDLDKISHLLVQIASALDHVHRQGFVHWDVKSRKILLDEVLNAYLTDFFIAFPIGGKVNAIIGTPAYMAPEQCEKNAKITPATDQYGLGTVLYEMVTGRTPYQADTPIAMINKKLTEPLPSPSKFRSDLPKAAELVILKALEKKPEARFESCGDLAGQFAAALARK